MRPAIVPVDWAWLTGNGSDLAAALAQTAAERAFTFG
jgi:hypothetical protein